MARNRMIKPEFWEDDKIGECSPTARLLFIAMWNFADDEGFLEDRPRWLKAKCFPYDNFEIEPLVAELVNVGRIEIQGGIIRVRNFKKHQRIDKPYPSKLSQVFNDSPTIPGAFPERSFPNIKEREVKIKENKEKEINKSPPEIEQAPVDKRDPAINKMLEALKAKIGISAFVDSRIERNMAKNCLSLMSKIGPPEFSRRLGCLLSDPFQQKNCNKILFVYNNIKGFIEPNLPNKDLIV